MRSIMIAALLLVLAPLAVAKRAEPELAAAEEAILAAEIVQLVARAVPADASSVWLAPPYKARRPAWSSLDNTLVEGLRELGFAVAEQKEIPAGAARIDYELVAMAEGMILRMHISDRVHAARYYQRDAGGLSPLSALSVQGMEQ